MRTPSVFISYSSDSKRHSDWVRRFATDLVHNGVKVKLDQWDLEPNGDLTSFMTESIEKTDFVLMICTPRYCKRASRRFGGVAFEHWIISGAIHTGAADVSKFYPVLRSGQPSASIPAYLRNRYFADFREDSRYTDSLDRLVRFLLKAPMHPRPRLRRPQAADSHASPSAWVLVAGTGIVEEVTEKCRQTAERFGQYLAGRRYGLVTGGWPGVDEIASYAFAQRIELERLPLEDFLTQVVVKTQQPVLSAGRLIFVDEGDREWLEGIRLADAVVLIGGLGGAYTTGRWALDAGKVVLPIADTGGDARQLYDEIVGAWSNEPVPGLSRNQFRSLGRRVPAKLVEIQQLLDSAFSNRSAS